jgi:hypothetical protein
VKLSSEPFSCILFDSSKDRWALQSLEYDSSFLPSFLPPFYLSFLLSSFLSPSSSHTSLSLLLLFPGFHVQQLRHKLLTSTWCSNFLSQSFNRVRTVSGFFFSTPLLLFYSSLISCSPFFHPPFCSCCSFLILPLPFPRSSFLFLPLPRSSTSWFFVPLPLLCISSSPSLSSSYYFIFASLVLFHYTVPATNRFHFFGLNVNDKVFTYLLGFQLLFSSSWSSFFTGLCGITSGLLYTGDVLRLRQFTLPSWVSRICSSLFLPLLQSSTQLRRSVGIRTAGNGNAGAGTGGRGGGNGTGGGRALSSGFGGAPRVRTAAGGWREQMLPGK